MQLLAIILLVRLDLPAFLKTMSDRDAHFNLGNKAKPDPFPLSHS